MANGFGYIAREVIDGGRAGVGGSVGVLRLRGCSGVVAVSIKALDHDNVQVVDWIDCLRLASADVGGLRVVMINGMLGSRVIGLACRSTH